MTNYIRGNRVFYDAVTGLKLWETGEVFASPVPVPHPEIIGTIEYLDIEPKTYNPMEKYIASIDPVTKTPIFKNYFEPEVDPEPTEEVPTEGV